MNEEDKYTIYLPNYELVGYLIGDWFDAETGARLIGPYCMWPKSRYDENYEQFKITITS